MQQVFCGRKQGGGFIGHKAIILSLYKANSHNIYTKLTISDPAFSLGLAQSGPDPRPLVIAT
jgi:hypothetical protein